MANELKLKLAIEGGQVVSATLDGVSTKIGDIGERSASSTTLLGSLKGQLAAIATIGTATALIRTADAVTTLNTQLAQLLGTTALVNQTSERLFQISQRTRTGFMELGSTYAVLARSGLDLGYSQERLLKVTEAVGYAMTIGGGSAESMKAALVQLGQGLGSGTLRGDELNSILEQTPRLARAIADGLGVTIGQLRALGEQGKLTSSAVIEALEKAAPKLAAEMSNSTLTVGQAFTMLSNSLTRFVGEADAATGFTGTLAKAMQSLSGAIDTVGKVISEHKTAFTVVLAALTGGALLAALPAIAGGIGLVATAVAGLGVVLLANPLILALFGVGAAIAGGVTLWNEQAKSVRGMTNEVKYLTEQIDKSERLLASTGVRDELTDGLEKRIASMKKARADLQSAMARDSIGSVGSGDTALAKAQAQEERAAFANAPALDTVRKTAQLRNDILAQANTEAVNISKSFYKAMLNAEGPEERLALEKERNQRLIASAAETTAQLKSYDDKQAAPGREAAKLRLAATIESYEEQQSAITAGEQRSSRALEAQHQAGLVNEQAFIDRKREIGLSAIADQVKVVEKERDAVQSANLTAQDKLAGVNKYNGELKKLKEAERGVIEDSNNAVLVLQGKFRKDQEAADQAALDSQLKDVSALRDSNEQLRLQNQQIGLTTDALNRLTVARIDNRIKTQEGIVAEHEEIAAMDALNGTHNANTAAMQLQINKLQELQKLRGLTVAGQQRQAQVDVTQAPASLKDVASYLDPSKAQSFGDVLKAALDGAGDSMVKLGTAFDSYARKNDLLAKFQKAVANDSSLNPAEKIKLATKLTEQQKDAQIDAYADMAGAAKGFFEKNSTGYKVLDGIEKAAHLVRLANMAERLITSTLLTTTEIAGNTATAASGVASDSVQIPTAMALAQTRALGAVANQGSGDPYSAFGRIATMAAIMGGLGLLIGGGMGGGGGGGASTPTQSEIDQNNRNEGKGTVFGDKDAVSKSISDSLSALKDMAKPELKYTSQMVALLTSINSSLGGATNALLQSGLDTSISGKSLGGGESANSMSFLQATALGGFIGGISNELLNVAGLSGAVFGGSKTSVTGGDTGLSFGKGSINDLIKNPNVRSFQDITTTTDSKGFLGTNPTTTHDTKRTFSGSDPELNSNLSRVAQGLLDVTTVAGKTLGASSANIANAGNLDTGLSDLKLNGLSGSEITEKLSGVFSALGDRLAKEVMPGLESFQAVGEGYLQTLTRVASGFEYAGAITDKLGLQMVALADIENKQGDVAAELVRQTIVGAEGLSGVGEIIQDFSGSAGEIADLYTGLVDVRGALLAMGASADTVSIGLLKGAGGLDALAGYIGDFQDGFLSTGEQLTVKQSLMDSEFGKLGMETPKTAEAFHDLVLGLMAGGEATSETLGRVLALSGGMRDLFDTSDALAGDLADSAQEIADAAEAMADRVKNAMGGLSDTRFGLENQLLTLQGNTGEVARRTREADLAKLTDGITDQADKDRITAAYDYNKGLEEQIKTLTNAKQAAEESARAQQQAADAASRAAEQVKSAWQSLTNSVFDEVQRIRGLMAGNTPDSLAAAQASFAIATAQAQAGDQEAYKLLPKLSQAVTALAETNTGSLVELRRIQAQTASSLEYTGKVVAGQRGLTVPAFAGGGDHSGGWAMVGENGPELAYMPPARIYTASNTRSMLNSGGGDTSEVVAAVLSLDKRLGSMEKQLGEANGYLQRTAKGTNGQPENVPRVVVFTPS